MGLERFLSMPPKETSVAWLEPWMLHASLHYKFVLDRAKEMENEDLSKSDRHQLGLYTSQRIEDLIALIRRRGNFLPVDFVLDASDNSRTTFDFDKRQVVVTTHEKGRFNLPKNIKTTRLDANEWAEKPEYARNVANGLVDQLAVPYRDAILGQAEPKVSLPADEPGGILDQV